MKKFIVLALALSLVAVALFGCAPANFNGDWTFAEISKVELAPDLSQEDLALLMQHYGVQDETGLVNAVRDEFVENQTFATCYIKFGKKLTLTYDPLFEREATWFFYKLSETEGFLSFHEIEEVTGNPDPIVYPTVVYNAESDTMSLTIQHTTAYMVTILLTK